MVGEEGGDPMSAVFGVATLWWRFCKLTSVGFRPICCLGSHLVKFRLSIKEESDFLLVLGLHLFNALNK